MIEVHGKLPLSLCTVLAVDFICRSRLKTKLEQSDVSGLLAICWRALKDG